MPPVFGPSSPSPMRLKSCAAGSGTATSPAHSASSETSGPSSRSSITSRRPASPRVPATRKVDAARSASSASSQTTTPLPAASPSALTTTRPPDAAIAARASAMVATVRAAAVGTPAPAMTSFANAFEPSSCAASRPGPKTEMPAARRASARPSTSGASGPTTTRSTRSELARETSASTSSTPTGWHVARLAMPGVAGRAVELAEPRAAAERVREGVLATASAHDQHPHHRVRAYHPPSARSRPPCPGCPDPPPEVPRARDRDARASARPRCWRRRTSRLPSPAPARR